MSRAGSQLETTDIEYRILFCLGNADRVVTQRVIAHRGGDKFGLERNATIRIHISRRRPEARRNLRIPQGVPRFIPTETGVGYRFMPPANAPD